MANMLLIVFIAATTILALFTLLPLWRCEAWWVRSLDFPRLQLFVISMILLPMEIIWLNLSRPITWGLLAVSLACLAYHAWWIVPYTAIFPVEVKPAEFRDDQRMIRIMTANVLTPNRNAEGLLDIVQESTPDILVTLESDDWWQEHLDTLESDYPHTIKCPLDNLYGMHVYSRFPLEDSQTKYLVESDIPSMHTAVILPSGDKIRAHFLHPAPPSPTENDESSERDAELIIVAKRIAESNAPVIVTGDLNDVAWSETTRLFRKISGLLDPRVGRGMFNTFHAKLWFLRWPLDHLFHSEHFTLSCICRLRRFGSDHFALFTELMLEKGGHSRQTALQADQDDLDWAKSKADRQGVSKDDVPRPGTD
jgi:endonuclease/exonuclease/phosphatase (EEP) superfamily protein YafD